MTPQETALVTTLLERLKATAGQPKHTEAEALIQRTTADQPDSTYYLAKTVLIHDLSLHTAQNRIAELEKNLADAQTAPSPPSFLEGLLDRTFQPNAYCSVRKPGTAPVLEQQGTREPVTFCVPRQRTRP